MIICVQLDRLFILKIKSPTSDNPNATTTTTNKILTLFPHRCPTATTIILFSITRNPTTSLAIFHLLVITAAPSWINIPGSKCNGKAFLFLPSRSVSLLLRFSPFSDRPIAQSSSLRKFAPARSSPKAACARAQCLEPLHVCGDSQLAAHVDFVEIRGRRAGRLCNLFFGENEVRSARWLFERWYVCWCVSFKERLWVVH